MLLFLIKIKVVKNIDIGNFRLNNTYNKDFYIESTYLKDNYINKTCARNSDIKTFLKKSYLYWKC